MDTGVLSMIPRELQHIIQQQRHAHVLNRRFTRQEIEWLLKTRRFLAVTYVSSNSASVECYSSGVSERLNIRPAFERMDHLSRGRSEGRIYSQELDVHDVEDNDVINRLEGAFDLTLHSETEYMVEVGDDEGAEALASLLDLRSLFFILRQRAQDVGFPVSVAKQGVLSYVTRIAQDMRSVPALLEMYLISSALTMELDIPMWWEEGEMSAEMSADAADRCTAYLTAIRAEFAE